MSIASWFRRHAMLVVVCVIVTVPVWIVRYPPMQDFPLHVATLRILHDLDNPHFGFASDFQLTLGRTQYIGFYLAGHLLAFVVGVPVAARLLICFYLAGTLLALRSLLLALGRDPWLFLAAVPVLYNPLLALGLLPFLISIPVLLWGVAALLAEKRAPSFRTSAAVAAIGFSLVYLHVASLGLFLVAALLLFPYRAGGGARAAAVVSLVPCAGALAWWLLFTNVGRSVFAVTTHWGTGESRPPFSAAVADMYPWLANAFPDPSDEITFAITLCAVAAIAWSAHKGAVPLRLQVPYYGILPLFCLALYLTGARSRGVIWPLAQRYMLPAALLAIPLLPLPTSERAGRWAKAALAACGALCVVNAAVHYVRFDRDDLGDFPAALEQMDARKHVAALIFQPRASSSRFWPFLHFGSYYQVEKGGVVDFTFAGYDQWPVDFEKGRYPLFDGPASPRWEWLPSEVVRSQPLSSYFDYALVRDRGDQPAPAGYRSKWSGRHWEVFERER